MFCIVSGFLQILLAVALTLAGAIIFDWEPHSVGNAVVALTLIALAIFSWPGIIFPRRFHYPGFQAFHTIADDCNRKTGKIRDPP